MRLLGRYLAPSDGPSLSRSSIGPPELECFLTALNPLSFAEAARLMTLKVLALSAVTGHLRVFTAQRRQGAVNLMRLPANLNAVVLIVA